MPIYHKMLLSVFAKNHLLNSYSTLIKIRKIHHSYSTVISSIDFLKCSYNALYSIFFQAQDSIQEHTWH